MWFVGIGGAGLSGYAVLARAWGAEVAGWDRRETPYLAYVRAAGIPVELGPDPAPAPPGWESVVSTAFAGRATGRTRADFLRELVGMRRSIVVGGAHGKTTTAAMIAFVLDRLGLDPAYLVGGEVPQLGGNAGTGSGWLVVEGDESDRTVFALPAEIAVVTNVELDHHTSFASAAELERLFDEWAAGVPHVVWGAALAPLAGELAVPGEHNRRNAACALAALELAGVERSESLSALREFRGAGRRLEEREPADGVRLLDDYAHHPAEVAATLAAARELAGGGRLLVLFQPHLYSRTLHLGSELASALAAADAACVTDIYPAREEPVAGVSGKLVVDRLAERRPGMPIGWAPSLEDAARLVAGWARQGDVVVTVGAGDVDGALPLLRERLAG
ncbi:MAG TPA: cyanophycin synthetase [Gaiellaceae bacterium]|nr:cyanophycin synthetase [Gaiellaceae bacterium]